MIEDINQSKKQRGKKKRLFVFLGIIILISISIVTARYILTNRLAATVNGEPIYLSEVERLNRYLNDRQKTLDVLIRQKVLIQAAIKEGLTANDKEIAEKQKYAPNYYSDEEDSKAYAYLQILSLKMSDHFKESFVKSSISKYTPTDSEIKKYYKANKEDLGEPAEVKVRVLEVDESQTKNILASPLITGRPRVWSGKFINEGWMKKSDLGEEAFSMAFNTAVGDVAGPVEKSPGLWVVIDVKDKKDVVILPLSKVRQGVVSRLIETKEAEARTEAIKAYVEWLANKLKKANIKRYI